MNLLPFDQLEPFRPRRFIDGNPNLGDWSQVEPYLARLERQIAAAASGADLEQWLLDWSELTAAVEQEGTLRHITMTCHTDNPEAEKAYLDFLEKVEPKLKQRQFELSRLLVSHPKVSQLPAERYQVLLRDLRLSVELFRPENVPLETEEARIGQQYQKLSGGLTVVFRGEEKTLAQMGRYQEDPDRATREEAWKLVVERRLQEREAFEEMFDRLIGIRQQIARNAGFDNYRDYAFRRLGRFDYTPDDCLEFHAAVEAELVPVLRDIHRRRREMLQLSVLRPWDVSVDPLKRPPLRPFQTVLEMLDHTGKVMSRLDAELAGEFAGMRRQNLLDLQNRKGKGPGGYQSTLSEARVPFIFMNAVGLQRDMETIFHEAGHAFHALATRHEDLLPYRGAPMEFCEVASMSMELLANEYLEEFYSTEDAQRARRSHLESIISIMGWIATVDAFQHWIYTQPNIDRAARVRQWTELMGRFGGEVNWEGFGDACAYLWHRQLHIFLHAFYYIEYGIAQLGALQVWSNWRRQSQAALAAYKSALALGGARPLPDLFHTAGCQFDFSRKTIGPVAGLLRSELERLPA